MGSVPAVFQVKVGELTVPLKTIASSPSCWPKLAVTLFSRSTVALLR